MQPGARLDRLVGAPLLLVAALLPCGCSDELPRGGDGGGDGPTVDARPLDDGGSTPDHDGANPATDAPRPGADSAKPDAGAVCGNGSCEESESCASCPQDCGACPQKTCTNPVFTTSAPNGGWSDGGYYVHNNMWNSASYQCSQTLYACAYDNWYVVANMNNNSGDGAVKTYPNVHKDYNNVSISSFNAITSTFAATSPHVGIYNVAYDIWTNGVATAGSTELMIWTENYNQVPAGSKAATTTFGGMTYDVYKTSSNSYIAFVPNAPLTSGTLDLLAIFNWTISKGWLAASSTLGQIDFGVEIVSTDGKDVTFTFTDFSITSN
jgi:hypothetical protein